MSSKSEDELVAFIIRPENFDTACEIVERFPRAKIRLQARFWSRLKQRLEKLVAESPKEFKGWECELEEGDPLADYFCIYLTPKVLSPGKLYCRPALQQDTKANRYQLSYGICWSDEVTSERRFAEYDALKNKLGDLKMTGGDRGWWIGRASMPYFLQEPETLRQLARDDSMERLEADQLVGLFRETKNLMEKLNQALAKK